MSSWTSKRIETLLLLVSIHSLPNFMVSLCTVLLCGWWVITATWFSINFFRWWVQVQWVSPQRQRGVWSGYSSGWFRLWEMVRLSSLPFSFSFSLFWQVLCLHQVLCGRLRHLLRCSSVDLRIAVQMVLSGVCRVGLMLVISKVALYSCNVFLTSLKVSMLVWKYKLSN